MSKTKTNRKLKSSWNWDFDFERKKSTEDKLHKIWNSKYFSKKTAKRAHPWGVLVLLQLYWAPDIVEFVLGRFSHFNIAIAYTTSTFCGTWTPSFCEFTQIFSKTSTPLVALSYHWLPLATTPIVNDSRNVKFETYSSNIFTNSYFIPPYFILLILWL